MPEALAVLFVFAVCVLVYAIAWMQTRRPSAVNVRDELQRLQAQEAWLHERLQRARRERWDDAMIAGLVDELCVITQQLAHLQSARR
jgi:hypothetical protein